MLVRIKQGQYRNQDIVDVTVPLVKEFALGSKGGFITVDGTSIGYADKIRVLVNRNQFEIVGVDTANTSSVVTVVEETDDEILQRIGERFDILQQMTTAVVDSNIRAVIVSGPPGVGKSFIVHDEIETFNAFDDLCGASPRAVVIKGAVSGPLGLYQLLYEYSEKGRVIVFDDCDGILYNDDCLNMLKAALDTGKTRRISWHTDSRVLAEAGMPRAFNFNGGVIFISNLKFDSVGKRIGAHLEALRSRCHYLDLTLDTVRDRLLRIKQVALSGNLFDGYNFTESQEKEIVSFMDEHQHTLREVSLRTAVKIADLVRMNPTNWRRIALQTVNGK